MAYKIRMGTRSSPLALKQTHMAIEWLKKFPSFGHTEFHIIPMTTSGDRTHDRPLYDCGGKALFAKEIEEALLDNTIDIAVHSLKDMETNSPEGLALAAYLPREDPADALISPLGETVSDLPLHARIGTCSPRRKAQLLRIRPDLIIVPLRGNVGTRLQKLEQGEVDGLILAAAGLKRLDIHGPHMHILSFDQMLPAAGQGAIVLQCRLTDRPLAEDIAQTSDAATALCVCAERSLLQALGGSCKTPIGAFATRQTKGHLRLRAMLARDDTSTPVYAEARGTDPSALGESIAKTLMKLLATTS